MSHQPDSTQPPEGFETRRQPNPLPDEGDRPDWLVGAADVLGDQEEAPARPMAPVARPKPPSPGPLSVLPGGKPERPSSWSSAASSVPKLSLVPSAPPAPPSSVDATSLDPDAVPDADLVASLPGLDVAAEAAAAPARPTFRPLDEPWYLVWGEALSANRKVQAAVLLGIVLLATAVFFPRHREPGASLHSILREPARFEGRSVVVRGEVLESFDVGQGYAFNLRQGRDTVVVFSPSRRPDMHQRVEVIGTVSTGYLDGEPRVAIFEAAK